MLILQCLIAIYIGTLNAQNAAGQGNAIDILMNSTGLLVLNDMDNVVGVLFNLQNSQDEDAFKEKIKRRDIIFAQVITFPHLVFVTAYSLWFLGIIEFSHPLFGQELLTIYNPYSYVFFPLIVLIFYVYWYCLCCNVARLCKCCKEDDDEISTESETTSSSDSESETTSKSSISSVSNGKKVVLNGSSSKVDPEKNNSMMAL